MDSSRVGVLGAGFTGTIHVEALRKLPFVEVPASSEKDEVRARAADAALNIPRAYGDSFDLLRYEDVDAAHIAILNHLHYPFDKLAMHGVPPFR